MKYIPFILLYYILSVHTAFSQVIVIKSEDRFDLSYGGKALIHGIERYSEVGKSFNLLVMGGVLIPSQKSELEKKIEDAIETGGIFFPSQSLRQELPLSE